MGKNKPLMMSLPNHERRCLSFDWLRMRGICVFIVLLLFQSFRADAKPDGTVAFPPELDADLSAGATAVYLMKFDLAQEHFRRAIELRPEHPAAYFFNVMLTWYRLTYDSLLNRDPVLEKLLQEQADACIRVAKKFSDDSDTEAVGYLYWGGAMGAKGWYHVIRNQYVRAYFDGKKGYSLVSKAAEIDPELYDAYLGLGMYQYYTATLGPTLKVLASFAIRGDKDSALRNLLYAEVKSRYVRFEAATFLWNSAMDEKHYEDAMEKVKFLLRYFPESPLFKWCEINTIFAQGRWEEALKKGEEYISLSQSGPHPQNYIHPYKLLLSKVLYHCGICSLKLGRVTRAKYYFDKAIDQPAEFEGWKVLAYLRRGEIFDMEGKRMDALGMYRVVLKYHDFWDSHKTARRRIREPYRGY